MMLAVRIGAKAFGTAIPNSGVIQWRRDLCANVQLSEQPGGLPMGWLESQNEATTALEQFVLVAAGSINGVEHATVTVLSAQWGVQSSAASDDFALHIHALQTDMLEGPCVDAVNDRHTVRTDDLSREGRWPRFTPAVLSQTPVRSMMAFRLHTDLDNLGALSLHANRPNAFGSEAEHSGQMLAASTAIALQAYIQHDAEFQLAPSGPDTIGHAMVILMQRYDISADTASSVLTRLSQWTGKPIAVTATEIVDISKRTVAD
jgi:hypothetical protein